MKYKETPTISDSFKKMESNQFELYIDDFDNNYYTTIFILKENNIQIKCNPIDSNEKYIREVSLEDWRYLNNYFSSFRNIKEIFSRLSKVKNNDCSIKKEINLISLKMKFYDKFQNYSATLDIKEIKENKSKESKESKSNEMNKENKNLKNNNENENLVKRIEILEDFINKLKQSLPFNSIDLSLYELVNVFNNLGSKELISKKEKLGLINSGIKKVFKQNISDCILIYKFDPKDNNDIPNKFRSNCEVLNNILIIIKTMNNKIFGFFYKEENNNNFMTGNFGIIETIFDTRNYLNDSFAFSFNKDKIYYSDISHKDSYENPGFALKFNYNKSSFFGNEYINKKINSNLYDLGAQVQNYPNIQPQYQYQEPMENLQEGFTEATTVSTTSTTTATNYQKANIQQNIQYNQSQPSYSYYNNINTRPSSNQCFQTKQVNPVQAKPVGTACINIYTKSNQIASHRNTINNDNSNNPYILSGLEEFNIFN